MRRPDPFVIVSAVAGPSFVRLFGLGPGLLLTVAISAVVIIAVVAIPMFVKIPSAQPSLTQRPADTPLPVTASWPQPKNGADPAPHGNLAPSPLPAADAALPKVTPANAPNPPTNAQAVPEPSQPLSSWHEQAAIDNARKREPKVITPLRQPLAAYRRTKAPVDTQATRSQRGQPGSSEAGRHRVTPDLFGPGAPEYLPVTADRPIENSPTQTHSEE